jgi:hypothetical protein
MDCTLYLNKRKETLQQQLAQKDVLQEQFEQAQLQIKQLQETCLKLSVLYSEINEAEIAQELAVIDELLASAAIDKHKKNSSTKPVGDKSDNLSEV